MSHRFRYESFQPVAGILACIFPGLGHWYLDGLRRGALVCLGVMGLFVAGMFIGGVDVVDRKKDQWWFVLQAGVGPTAFAVDRWRDAQINDGSTNFGSGAWGAPTPPPVAPSSPGIAITTSLGKVNEVGSLYAGMAGLMNLIAIIDAFWNVDRDTRRRRRATGDPAAQAPEPGASA